MRISGRGGITTRPGVSDAGRQRYQRRSFRPDAFDPAAWNDRREAYGAIMGEERRTAATEIIRRAEQVEALAAADSPLRDLFVAEGERLRKLAKEIMGGDHA